MFDPRCKDRRRSSPYRLRQCGCQLEPEFQNAYMSYTRYHYDLCRSVGYRMTFPYSETWESCPMELVMLLVVSTGAVHLKPREECYCCSQRTTGPGRRACGMLSRSKCPIPGRKHIARFGSAASRLTWHAGCGRVQRARDNVDKSVRWESSMSLINGGARHVYIWPKQG
jgi:hypothetical protein